jgi:hypothetical protein
MSIDFKCALTTACLSVLVFMLLVEIFTRYADDKNFIKNMDENTELRDWWKTIEVHMLIAVFLAFNINNLLFSSCKTA